MIYNLYSIQDTLVGFNAPFIMVNENVAKREYQHYLETSKNPEDMRLFKIGTFDDASGTIIGKTPTQIMGGKTNGDKDN